MEHQSSEPPPNYRQSDGQDPGSSCIPIYQPMKDLFVSLQVRGWNEAAMVKSIAACLRSLFFRDSYT